MTVPGEPDLTISFDEMRAHLTERGVLELELATQRATNAKLQEALRREVAARVAAENLAAPSSGA